MRPTVAFGLRRPLVAFCLWLAAFTLLTTCPLWLPRGDWWLVVAVLALVAVVGESVRRRPRRGARGEGRAE